MGSLMWSYQLLCLQLLLFYSHSSSAALCLHEETSALLQFKQLFSFDKDSSYDCNFIEVPSYPKMMSWKEASDCCSWDGVTCDTVTGHVIGLDLSCSWLHGNIPSNASLFLLRHLQSLNLAFNDFNFSEISSDFSRLSSLTLLNLSYSYFEGQIPFEISQLSKLFLLDLSSNYHFYVILETPVLEGLVQNLTQLRHLTLDLVDMSTVTPSSLSNLSSSLTSLSLRDCGMRGDFPDHIFNLPNLQVLDLFSNTDLTGNFPKNNWSNPFKHLDVSYTSLSGGIPDSIGNLKSLRYLGLSHCELFGPIPISLGNLTQLTHLDLSSNNFIGTISDIFVDLTQLTHLDLSSNNFTGTIPDTFGNFALLTFLDLSSNHFIGTIPDIFGSLTQLTVLELSRNNFIGTAPDIFVNHTKLTVLGLSSNNFTGTVPNIFGGLTKLLVLELSYNNFIGTIPDSFVNLTQLSVLSLRGNQLVGPIPSLLGELQNLISIDFRGNTFNGTIPPWLLALPLLDSVDLGNNQLSGHIEEFQGYSLQSIYLDGNRLNGSIPSSIFELVNLTALVLSSNNLSGGLEFSMFAKLKSLGVLDLSYNRLSVRTTLQANFSLPQLLYLGLSACNISEYPVDILRSSNQLERLELSDNKIHGKIPNWMWDSGRDTLNILNLSHNFLTGIEQLPWKNLFSLDLRSNLLQGSIPNPPLSLKYFLISNNKLTGVIPHFICNLSYIEVLDLSNNRSFRSF